MGLLGKLTGADAAKKSAKKAKKDIALREGRALGELSPEKINALMQMFFSKYMGLMGPSMMAGQQRLNTGLAAGGGGLARSGLAQTLRAGLPAQYTTAALEKAIEPSMSLAGQRAGVVMGSPIVQEPGRGGLSDLVDLALQVYTGGLASTGSTRQQSSVFK